MLCFRRFGACRTAQLLVLAALVGPAVMVACSSAPEAVGCPKIPSGGCPVERGGTCDDPTCSELFECVGGEWHHVKSCPPNQMHTNPFEDAGDAGDGDASDAACTLFGFNHHGEVQGCEPDLEEPDCPAAAAEGCVEDACLTGCSDFYLCLSGSSPQCEDAGKCWVTVGYCADDGGFRDTQF